MITSISLSALQSYWWVLVSVLGAVLVFLLFVQGGQSMLLFTRQAKRRDMIVSIFGRKWELTFTTLVTFGGAAFASFPLFYSTSFGGAYWLWMLILLSFVLQAVSYEFRTKPGHLFPTRVYDFFLFFNGLAGCVLLGVAVAMFFFGAEFTVCRANLLDASSPVISSWSSSHGLEAIACWKNLLLGFAVFFLARTMASIYMTSHIAADEDYVRELRRSVLTNGIIFLILFLGFLAVLLCSDGLTMTVDGATSLTPYKYLDNFLALPVALVLLVVGALLTVAAIFCVALKPGFRYGSWLFGLGTVAAVLSLFFVAGFNDTPFYPSLLDPDSSLTIRNASSTQFTLTCMSWASLIIPVVVAYIAYCWRALSRDKVTVA